MFDRYYCQALLIMAVPLVLIFAAPFLSMLIFRRRVGQSSGSSFWPKPVKLPWVSVALLLADLIFRCSLFGILAIMSVPLVYHFRRRKAGSATMPTENKRP